MKNFLTALVLAGCLFATHHLHADTQEQKEETTKTLTTWEARLEYARLLSNLKRYDESLKHYEKLLAEKPDSIVTLPICRTTNTLACKECPSIKIESYPKGMEPKSTCKPGDFDVTGKDNVNPIVQNLNTNISPPAYH